MYRELGETKIKVFPIGLGGMPLSIEGRPDESYAIKVLHAAIENGVNFIDTADVYCLDDDDIGHNERLIRKALMELNTPVEVTVATKGGLIRPGGDWKVDARPTRLKKACELSLENLGVESITLYQLHAPDEKVPFEDIIETLLELKREGKILHVGLSNVSLEQLKKAQKIVRIESVQNECNPFKKKDFKNGLIEYCFKEKISYIPYSPFGGSSYHKKIVGHNLFCSLSKIYGESPYCVVLNWLISKFENIIPIPGASKKESIIDSVKAVNIELKKEDIEKIDNLSDGICC